MLDDLSYAETGGTWGRGPTGKRNSYLVERLEGRLLLSVITSGQEVSRGIASSGQQDSYTFSAMAGGTIEASVGDPGYSMQMEMDLFSPTGTLLQSVTNTAGQTVTISSTPGTDGTYSIVLESANGGTGVYNFSVASVPGTQYNSAIASGQEVSNSMNGQLDTFDFTATAGGTIEASVGDPTYSMQMKMELFSPTGTLLQSVTNTAGQTVTISPTPETGGTYYIVLESANGGTGVYNFSVASVPGTQYNSAIASGQEVSNSLNGQLDTYDFTATAGGTIEASVGDPTYSMQMKMELFSPTGTLLQSVTNTAGQTVTISPTPETGGTYYIVLESANGGTGVYNFSVASVPGTQYDSAIASGQEVSNSINGQLDTYHFTATAGGTIEASVGDLDYAMEMEMDLFSPTGILLQSVAASTEGQTITTSVTPTTTGTYYIVLKSANHLNGVYVGSVVTSVSVLPTLLTLAHLSSNVYSGDAGYGGFTPFASSTDPENSGYFGAAYINPDDTQVVVAFRGTVLSSGVEFIKTLAADVSFASSIATPFLVSEVADAAAFVASVHSLFPTVAITLTGHSLGAALAQLVGEASGLNTDAFNAPGAAQLYNQLASELAPVVGLGAGGTNINYRLYGDQVSLFGMPIGTTTTLQDPAGTTFSTVTDPLQNAVANLGTFLNLHFIGTIIDQIAANAPYVSSAGQPNDAQALENYIQPTSLQDINGLPTYAFAFAVTNVAGALLDPSSGKSFVLTEQAGSPGISSVDLPILTGISAYNVRYETGTSWSTFQTVQPDVQFALGPNADGIEIDPLDSEGQNVAITDSFLFDMSFASTGAFTGAMTVTPGNPAGLSTSTGAQYSVIGFPGAQILDVASGTVTLGADFSTNYAGYTLKIESGANVILASNQNVSAVQLIGSASLDIRNYSISINYGSNSDPISTIASYIKSGYSSAAWNGSGIMSTVAQSNSGSYGIGYADSADPNNPAGLPSGTIEIMYTLLGDANLDGTVNSEDFTLFSNHLGESGMMWDDGDFNYDSVVNSEDFTLFSDNLNQAVVSSADLAANAATAATSKNQLTSQAASPIQNTIAPIHSVTEKTKSRKSPHHDR